ncbi:MAG: UDP-3-O-acyl-N-acetylglucosamine deacetylase [Deltaproteobacteria bacterium]|jgi:UDP-3-O-[3-hydroxymyristoyl] N-acetylglucosamine deacetylase|nr:UDP-3-O-acyl-N-acetylglucosamine deacetylase [Deltaproteobacteria bacterium]
MHNHQKTIKQRIQVSGKGLHTNAQIDMILTPKPANYGIWFLRTDDPANRPVLAANQNVSDTSLATSIGTDGEQVGTVEHFLAALTCLGVNNLQVDINGCETPAFDGSALPWIELLRNAGLRTLNAPRSYYQVKRSFELRDGDKRIAVEPASEMSVDFTIDFPGHINNQRKAFSFTENGFISDIAPARTFCLLSEVEKMQKMGRALGGGLDNAVVISGDGAILNQEGLRFPDECVRHKILDFFGDMTLAQAPVIGRFTVEKSGHSFNQRFLSAILRTPGLLELVSPTKSAEEPYLPMAATNPSLNPAWAH